TDIETTQARGMRDSNETNELRGSADRESPALKGRRFYGAALVFSIWLPAASIAVQEQGGAPATPPPANAPPLLVHDISFRNEIQRAVDLGLAWLQKNQNTNGYWSTPDQPAITALALMAFNGDPSGRFGPNARSHLN